MRATRAIYKTKIMAYIRMELMSCEQQFFQGHPTDRFRKLPVRKAFHPL